ncbi:glycoside hydrolase family 43 protein [Nocardia sp. NPDC050712]|uniref:glycoside hydrolase family 43 protein n=1 Tax=Nocardia sp. NPDC050712 TaxID=3155518 RepID=UPI0033CFD151
MVVWRALLGAVLLGLGIPAGMPLATAQTSFTNPVLPAGADPSIAYDQGRFHLVQGDFYNDDNLVIRSADTLGGLADAEPTVVWEHGSCPGPACTKIWAPELQRIDDRWWIYFAAQENDSNDTHRMYALRSAGTDPTGPYEYLGQVPLPGGWAIDGAYLRYADSGYYVWSCLNPDNELMQQICAVRMADPMTPVGERVVLAAPADAWETVPNDAGLLINEGPQPLIAPDGRLFMTFSANASFDDSYRLGLLELTRGGDVMDPAAWKKSGGPVLPGAPGAIAPGHNGFLTVEGRPWITYHARLEPGTGWAGRSVRAQPMTFDASCRPHFGIALGPEIAVTDGPGAECGAGGLPSS